MRLATYLVGCPDYTVPVSEVEFVSKVTGKREYLPASISLVGKPGCDVELYDVLDSLHAAGVVSDVLDGSRLYPKINLEDDDSLGSEKGAEATSTASSCC
jgi:hypothetical protein